MAAIENALRTGPAPGSLAGMATGLSSGPMTRAQATTAAQDRDTITMVREAIAARRVCMAWQPVVTAADPGQTAFHEGLVRVLDPGLRIIPARDFFPLVEEMDLGRELDCLSLEMGLGVLAQHPELRLSVNMSARSVDHPRWRAILQTGLATCPDAAGRLIIEITESSAILAPERVAAFMTELQARGIAFALDDFGAGHTAFRHFRDFRFDILKIDGQFIRNIQGNADNQVLVAALLMIARHFGMACVAEAVETREEAAWLTAKGVDLLQGYAFGAPDLVPAWAKPDQRRRA